MGELDFKKYSTTELLNYADRANPLVKELCERLETHIGAVAKERGKRNEFKRELNSLLGML